MIHSQRHSLAGVHVMLASPALSLHRIRQGGNSRGNLLLCSQALSGAVWRRLVSILPQRLVLAAAIAYCRDGGVEVQSTSALMLLPLHCRRWTLPHG